MNGEMQCKNASGGTDMEDEEGQAEATFRYVVQNFSEIQDVQVSKPCIVRNLPWKILLMPRVGQAKDKPLQKSLGFFLQCNGESESTTWTCFATADLRLINQQDESESFVRKISHLFNSKENDWGFGHYISWDDVLNPSRGFIKDDAIIVEVYVSADAPHGVYWDSKKRTGYVGLKNQGATCYMNSLLQTLFFTNQLRKAVYKMPTESDDSSKSVALALQRVFYELQFSENPVGTKKLTKSFGWGTLDSFMQHDVQEFLRVLLDKLENKMKGTCVEGTVPKLFEGKMITLIKCRRVNYTSSREETFYDIQLNIKGKINIEESFNEYTSNELLEGDNKYDAGEYGLQEAEKGIIFLKFPPILHLHLMRFHYDPATDSSVKYNGRFEFYEKITLDQYLLKPEATRADYTLHAVLVHSGDNHGGHYVVYINPKGDGRWCKFDDDVVSRCTKQEAIDHNYGGQEDDLHIRQCTSAYMLVYIRDSELSTVLQEVVENDIPEELVERLQLEKRIEDLRWKERCEAHLYMNLQLYLEDAFEGYQGTDLLDFDKAYCRVLCVKKQDTINEMLKALSEVFHYPAEQIRPWPFGIRSNQTYRPMLLDIISDEHKTIAEVSEGVNPWIIFLETVPADSKRKCLPFFDKDTDVLLFFKYYEPKNKTMHYWGHLYVPVMSKFRDLGPKLCKKLGLEKDTELAFYQEIKPNMVEEVINSNDPIKRAVVELRDGDLVIFQIKVREDLCFELPSCIDYFKDRFYRAEIISGQRTFRSEIIEVTDVMNFDQMVTKVARILGVDPSVFMQYKPETRKYYSEKPSEHPCELQTKKEVKCIWIGQNPKVEEELILYTIKDGTVEDLLAEAQKQLTLAENGSGSLRLLEISRSKIMRQLEVHKSLDTLTNVGARSYRIEEIPTEELNLGKEEMLLPVAHFDKDVLSTFGIPFLLKVGNGERFTEVKSRIQRKLNISDEEFQKYTFAIVRMGRPQFINDEDENKINLELFKQPYSQGAHVERPWLGLQHRNEEETRDIKHSNFDRSIKIYN